MSLSPNESTSVTRLARFLIEGRVQGVGFRDYVRDQAIRLELAGLARNLSDGRVEVLVRGPGDAIDQLEISLKQGPPLSVVKKVARIAPAAEPPPVKGFEIR